LARINQLASAIVGIDGVRQMIISIKGCEWAFCEEFL
jgi:hypothetical protein